ncbi:hypothetical protein CRM22_010625 [Opisthorchis felineus]|uniref:PDZ domain-containing protein n=1 Tax=Opisthorchis felineus TaxID=147828 RepID=A0A4S2KR58_OPIFE|nr:hypothetical protein CRM22_010625 [Opisthorchis felineus]
MFHVFENNNSTERRSVHNGVLITHDDLSDSYNLSRKVPSLYVKPLAPDKPIDPPQSGVSHDRRLPLPEKNAKLSLGSLPPAVPARTQTPVSLEKRSGRTFTTEFDSHRNGTLCPSLAKINRSSFQRNTSARRSLGGMATSAPWLDSNELGEISPTNLSPHHPSVELQSCTFNSGSQSNLDFSPLLQIRVVQLPSLDDLGFALDSYSDPNSGHFVGLRLCDRFQTRQFYFDSRENCPFRVGDIIVTINQHKLANMHESQAIRYVYNAFRDARQYTVEFGVFRPSDHFEDSPDLVTRKVYEPSTLPVRSSHAKRSSAVFLPSATVAESALERHQPRRKPSSSIPTHSPYILDVHGGRTELRQKSTEPVGQSSISQPGAPSISGPLLSKPEVKFTKDDDFTVHRLSRSIADQGQCSGIPNIQGAASAETGTADSFGSHQRTFSGRTAKDVNAFNTRTIGQKISIDLVKLAKGGLGFTLTSRDTKVSPQANEPVYVKKILSTGAAITDGRLLIGDRLLTVNGVEVENLEDAISHLRSISPGRTVELVVSRQATIAGDSRSSDRRSTRNSSATGVELPCRPFRSLTFEFYLPSLEESKGEPPHLGVNFKWALHPPGCDDSNPSYAEIPGLYVDSLLSDGLITQYGRKTLLPGDKLVGLNGENLEGESCKVIASRIKQVLSGATLEVPSPLVEGRNTRRRFSLTIHRYNGLDRVSSSSRSPHKSRSSIVFEEPEDESGAIHSSTIHWSDTRRRRISRAEQGLECSGESDKTRYPSTPPRLLENPHFQREGLGRRSVSEKRHAHVDATQFSFFQTNILPNRYKMPEEVDKQYSTMPTARRLKLYKERMAAAAAAGGSGPVKAMYAPEAPEEDLAPTIPPKSKADKKSSSHRDHDRTDLEPTQNHFRRGRKQNNSFRNAVDRSLTLCSPLDVPTPQLSQSANKSNVDTHRHAVGCSDKRQSFPAPRTDTVTHLEASPQHRGIPNPIMSPGADHTPPVPTRRSANFPVNSTELRKPNKRSFGSFKGLFRRSGKRNSHISPSTQVNSPTTPVSVSNSVPRRLSVPEPHVFVKDDRLLEKNCPSPKNPPPHYVKQRPHTVLDFDHPVAHKNTNQVTDSDKHRGRHSRARQVAELSVTPESNGHPPYITDLMQKVTEWRENIYVPPQPAPPVPPRAHRNSQPQKKVRSPKQLTSHVFPHAPIYQSETLYPQLPPTNVPSGVRASRSSSKQSTPHPRDHSPVYVPKQPNRPASAATLRSPVKSTGSGQLQTSASVHPRPAHHPPTTSAIHKSSSRRDNMQRIYANSGTNRAVVQLVEAHQPASREALYTNGQTHPLPTMMISTSNRAVPAPYKVQARKTGQAIQHRRG